MVEMVDWLLLGLIVLLLPVALAVGIFFTPIALMVILCVLVWAYVGYLIRFVARKAKAHE